MNTYTNKFTPLQAGKIKELLVKENAVFDTIQYAQWRAKTKGFQAMYYNSGKFLAQGKDVSALAQKIDDILGIKSVSTKPKEQNQETINVEHEVYIGTDESGKGDFFGPLVIAGVQVNKENSKLFTELGIKDSKKLDDEKIKKMSAHIRNNSIHSVIVITPNKYNELYSKFKNLNKLLAWGHARAIENILEKQPCEYALSDKFGDEKLIQNALLEKGQKIKLDQRVRAESNIAVAAASIIARAEYVKRMEELSGRYSLTLPKGASNKVLEQGKAFVKQEGQSALSQVAKLHFKTTQDILSGTK